MAEVQSMLTKSTITYFFFERRNGFCWEELSRRGALCYKDIQLRDAHSSHQGHLHRQETLFTGKDSIQGQILVRCGEKGNDAEDRCHPRVPSLVHRKCSRFGKCHRSMSVDLLSFFSGLCRSVTSSPWVSAGPYRTCSRS